ncbi:MAG: hypothetical protein WHT81_04185 [Rectinemataceae bacterium]|nr:hypothetical protein [Spirochaetaceae bacterium]
MKRALAVFMMFLVLLTAAAAQQGTSVPGLPPGTTPISETPPGTTPGVLPEPGTQPPTEAPNPAETGTAPASASIPGAVSTTIALPWKETPVVRAGVLAAGIFPFAYFYTGFALDLSRYVSNGFDPAYAPWPFKSAYSEPLTNAEQWLKLGIAAGLSLTLGVISILLP